MIFTCTANSTAVARPITSVSQMIRLLTDCASLPLGQQYPHRQDLD